MRLWIPLATTVEQQPPDSFGKASPPSCSHLLAALLRRPTPLLRLPTSRPSCSFSSQHCCVHLPVTQLQ
ncbi:lipopolysaccharide heptosyltransferase II [Sesbania bispinosa]|nr:lipopolysaccharide heptosyltransferase II [Sesbania bispinosa]